MEAKCDERWETDVDKGLNPERKENDEEERNNRKIEILDAHKEYIRTLSEKNKKKREGDIQKQQEELKLKQKTKIFSQINPSSRLFQPKRRGQDVISASKVLEQEKEAKNKAAELERKQRIKKMIRSGPDARQAAFLKKLAEEKKARKINEEQKRLEDEKRKKALSLKVKSILKEKSKPIQYQSDSDSSSDTDSRFEGKDDDNPNPINNNSSDADQNKHKSPRVQNQDSGTSIWDRHVAAAKRDKESNHETELTLDRARWAKRHGISENTPVFICSNSYPAVRKELKRRGWFENKDKESPFWDFCYAIRVDKIPYYKCLDEKQICNRFLKTGEICAKVGLMRNLRTLKWFDHGTLGNASTFFPRCYELSASDGDCEDFLDDFKVTAAERILKHFLFAYDSTSANKCCKISPYLLQVAINVCNRFVKVSNNFYINSESKYSPPLVSTIESHILCSCKKLDSTIPLLPEDLRDLSKVEDRFLKWFIQKHIKEYDNADKKKFEDIQSVDLETIERVKSTLKDMRDIRKQQDDINGKCGQNVWIVKPAGKSRGRGIMCFDDLNDLMRYTRVSTQESSRWVVQKYMENSLLIHKRKFDIRQWVLVTSWNPLTIYFYSDCYLRFCVNEYTLDNLQDKFIHLANNSISSKSKDFKKTPIEGNMWRQSDFIEYLEQNAPNGRQTWDENIGPKLREIVKASLCCVEDMIESRPHSFEIYGFDFMVDDQFNPWLIEINSSPSMEYSTEITKDMTRKALRDLVTCVLDCKYKHTKNGKRVIRKSVKKDVETGNWELIYEAKERVVTSDMLCQNDLLLEGKEIAQFNEKRLRQRNRIKVNNIEMETKYECEI